MMSPRRHVAFRRSAALQRSKSEPPSSRSASLPGLLRLLGLRCRLGSASGLRRLASGLRRRRAAGAVGQPRPRLRRRTATRSRRGRLRSCRRGVGVGPAVVSGSGSSSPTSKSEPSAVGPIGLAAAAVPRRSPLWPPRRPRSRRAAGRVRASLGARADAGSSRTGRARRRCRGRRAASAGGCGAGRLRLGHRARPGLVAGLGTGPGPAPRRDAGAGWRTRPSPTPAASARRRGPRPPRGRRPSACSAVRPSESITRQNGQPTAIWSAPVRDRLLGAVDVDPLADVLLHPHPGAAGAAAEGAFGATAPSRRTTPRAAPAAARAAARRPGCGGRGSTGRGR